MSLSRAQTNPPLPIRRLCWASRLSPLSRYCLHTCPSPQVPLSSPDVQFLASVLPPDTDPAFFEHLRAIDCSGVTVRALPEGSLAFPGVSVG